MGGGSLETLSGEAQLYNSAIFEGNRQILPKKKVQKERFRPKMHPVMFNLRIQFVKRPKSSHSQYENDP